MRSLSTAFAEAPKPNAVFDESGIFLLYSTLLGIKVRDASRFQPQPYAPLHICFLEQTQQRMTAANRWLHTDQLQGAAAHASEAHC